MFLVVLEKGGRFCWNDFVCQERLALSPVAKRGGEASTTYESLFFQGVYWGPKGHWLPVMTEFPSRKFLISVLSYAVGCPSWQDVCPYWRLSLATRLLVLMILSHYNPCARGDGRTKWD